MDKLVYDNHIKVVKRPYKNLDWDIVISKDACAIMYIDEEDYVYFVKQYRPALEKYILELPAETVDKNKSIKEIIKEGLEEECGIKIEINSIQHFGHYPSSSGHDTEIVHLFFARCNGEKTNQKLNKHEEIEIVKIKFSEAIKEVRKKIICPRAIMLLQHELLRRIKIEINNEKLSK